MLGCSSGSGSSAGRGTDHGGSGPSSDVWAVAAAGDVRISPPSGTFKDSIAVELSTATAGAEIRYTTDGRPPTAGSSLYTDALNLTATTRLRAQAFLDGAASGAESAGLFVARSIDATHDLPVIVLDSYGSGKLPTEATKRVDVDVAFLAYALNGKTASLADTPTSTSFAAFHVRGQSSAMFPKVPYRLELRTTLGDDRDCPMFGMASESDWALVGPYSDKTLIHNAFVYALGREMGLKAPELRYVELYVSLANRPLAAEDYQGVYQIVEIIKNQKDRLDLKQLDESVTSLPDITGGYIFKFEWRAAEEPLLPCPSGSTNCWKDLEIVDPTPINSVQADYLSQHLGDFNDALHGASPADEATGYPSYIDVQSFVDHVIVNEFTRNMDAYARSQYFYKDRDTKIYAGPLWDFDLIAGVGITPGGFMGSNFANTAAEGWQYESNATRLAGATSDWFPVLIAQPAFRARLVTRWKQLRAAELSDSGISTRVDNAAKGLSSAAERNFRKWNILSQQTVNPFSTPTEPTWAGQLQYMKTWLVKRAAWLDSQWI